MWGSILLLAVGLSLDALAAAFSYSLRGVRIPAASRGVIGLCSFLYAALALWAGGALRGVLPPGVAKGIGVALLLGLGLHSLYKALQKTPEAPKKAAPPHEARPATLLSLAIRSWGITISVVKDPTRGDLDGSQAIDAKEALLLGLALSVDAISVGVGAALSGVGHWLMPLLIAATQVALLCLGCALGRKATGYLPEGLLHVAPGVILLLIALLRLLS